MIDRDELIRQVVRDRKGSRAQIERMADLVILARVANCETAGRARRYAAAVDEARGWARTLLARLVLLGGRT